MQTSGVATAPPLVALDLIQTVAFAGLVLFLGYALKRFVPVLARYNLPAPVVGGMVVSFLILLAWSRGVTLFRFDATLREPLMIAFFTTIGFGASVTLLRVGGPLVVWFFALSTIGAVLQNVIGMAVATALGQPPLLGVLAGSVTLTGGPATGLAFAPLFERSGVTGAATIAVAAAMVGIVSGGILGGPIATFLITRNRLKTPRRTHGRVPDRAEAVVEAAMREPPITAPKGEDVEAYGLTKNLVSLLVAMSLGAWVSGWFTSMHITLPAYIGAMIVAAVIRNLDDATGVVRLSQRLIDDLGTVSLALFIVIALMTLRLWELAGLALPLAIILAWQVALIATLCWVIYRLMGRDYDAAVISGGFCGFMLGTTANAMANMEALVERYGPSPKAFLVVPMVGAFFIDFTNALIITFFLNRWGV